MSDSKFETLTCQNVDSISGLLHVSSQKTFQEARESALRAAAPGSEAIGEEPAGDKEETQAADEGDDNETDAVNGDGDAADEGEGEEEAAVEDDPEIEDKGAEDKGSDDKNVD